jgi:hypothetical protein
MTKNLRDRGMAALSHQPAGRGHPGARLSRGSEGGALLTRRRGPKAPSHDCIPLTAYRIPVEITPLATVLRLRPGSG